MSDVLNLVAAVGLLAVGFSVIALIAAWLAAPSISQALEQARIDREVQDAAWRIHQLGRHAFGQMLEAARQSEREQQR
jgi:hypothetical protein